MSFTPIAVQATRYNADGSLPTGKITFALNAVMTNADDVAVPSVITAVFGQSSNPIVLPLFANDDAGTSPASPSAAYGVIETLNSQQPATYSVIISKNATITDNAAEFTDGSNVVQLSNALACSQMVGHSLMDSTNFPSGVTITGINVAANTVTVASTASSTVTYAATLGGAVDLSTLAQYQSAPSLNAFIPWSIGQTDGQVPTWDSTSQNWVPGTGGGGSYVPLSAKVLSNSPAQVSAWSAPVVLAHCSGGDNFSTGTRLYEGGPWPEEAEPAYGLCADAGIGFNPHCQVLNDGVVVCMHDPTLARTAALNGVFPAPGSVTDYDSQTWASQVTIVPQDMPGQGVNWGTLPAPFLGDVLRKYGGKVPLVLEMVGSSPATVAAVAPLVETLGLQSSVMIMTGNVGDMTAAAAAGIPTAYLPPYWPNDVGSDPASIIAAVNAFNGWNPNLPKWIVTNVNAQYYEVGFVYLTATTTDGSTAVTGTFPIAYVGFTFPLVGTGIQGSGASTTITINSTTSATLSTTANASGTNTMTLTVGPTQMAAYYEACATAGLTVGTFSTARRVDLAWQAAAGVKLVLAQEPIYLNETTAIYGPSSTAPANRGVWGHGYMGDGNYSSRGTITVGTGLPLTISGVSIAANAVITTSSNHGLYTGQRITIAGVGGATAVNGTWTVTYVSATTFTVGAVTTGQTYTSGGTVTTVPGVRLDATTAQAGSQILTLGGHGPAAAGLVAGWAMASDIFWDTIGADNTRYAGFMIGNPDDTFATQSVTGPGYPIGLSVNGYIVILRASGGVAIYRQPANANFGTVYSTAAMAAGSTAYLKVTIEQAGGQGTTVTITATVIIAGTTYGPYTWTDSTPPNPIGNYCKILKGQGAGTSYIAPVFKNLVIG